MPRTTTKARPTPKAPKLKKGEIYAGITVHKGKPCHLVLLPDVKEKVN